MQYNKKKRVLITGETGYIARNLRLKLLSEGFSADNLSIRAQLPAPEELEAYGVVVHCAALVHEKRRAKKDYYKINTELTRRLALGFKRSGGGLFIFLSTMAVYGLEGSLEQKVVIDASTPLRPSGYYGKSKLLAEQALRKMESPAMGVAIIRPPIVYGSDCPGNYARLVRAARVFPVFPYVRNERSMIHIETLCGYIMEVIKNKKRGIFHPQDAEHQCTSLLVRRLAQEEGRDIALSPALGAITTLINSPKTRKAFGNLVYSHRLE